MTAETDKPPKRGRPFSAVSRSEVLKLRRDRYTWHDVARMLGISRATAMRIYHRPEQR